VNRLRAAFKGRTGAVLAVSLIVWALALFDLTLLPRVAGQYLGTLPAKRLVGVTVGPGSTLVTSTDPAAPANVWIISPRGTTTQVVGVQLPRAHSRRGTRHRGFTPSVRTTLEGLPGTPVDVEEWPGSGPALFVVSSPRQSPTLHVISLRTGRPFLESRIPLPPQRSDRRDFFVARWSGPRPDLFVIDRDVNWHRQSRPRRWSVRIYSGESNFQKLTFETFLQKKLSKQLSQENWWLDVGLRRQPRPSLVLIARGETGTGQTEVHILSGHSRFRRYTLHAITELPDEEGSTRPFVFQSERHGGAVLMAENQRGRLSLVPVPLP
jgi:hypothetical protein